jgi:hypothetical protein
VGRIFVFLRHKNTISTQSKDFLGEKRGSPNSPNFWGKKFEIKFAQFLEQDSTCNENINEFFKKQLAKLFCG